MDPNMSTIPRAIEDGGVAEDDSPAEAYVRMSDRYVELASRKANLEAESDDDELSTSPEYTSIEHRLRVLRRKMDAHLDEALASENSQAAFETIFGRSAH